MENFTTADSLKRFKLCKISIFFSNDNLGSVFLIRFTGTEPIFTIILGWPKSLYGFFHEIKTRFSFPPVTLLI